MKKLIVIVVTILTLITNVSAKDNKLYFKEENNAIYYESSMFDEKIFMNHPDMIPGSTYTDELIIENKTNNDYNLYFKVKLAENTNSRLLENISMKIKLDGKLIYDGKATGLDYKNEFINLQDSINLGEFKKNKSSKMIVETKLDEKYRETKETDNTEINWTFYAQYENRKPQEITEGNIEYKVPILPVISLILLIGILILLFAIRKKLEDSIKRGVPVILKDENLLLEIEKIDLKKKYRKDSQEILKESVMPNESGKVIINDYFDRINEIEAGDKATITYQEYKYTYTVLDKYYIKKDGYVEVDNNSKCNTLTLINRDINSGKNIAVIILYLTNKEDK